MHLGGLAVWILLTEGLFVYVDELYVPELVPEEKRLSLRALARWELRPKEILVRLIELSVWEPLTEELLPYMG